MAYPTEYRRPSAAEADRPDEWGGDDPYPCELCGVQGTQHEFVKAYVPGYGNVVGHPACVYAHGAETTK